MTARTVIRMGHPTLRKVAAEVNLEEVKSPEFKQLLVDMYETMKVEGGIGIAAPQINVSKQVALIELPDNSERYGELGGTPLMIIINPILKMLTQEHQGFWEGCLSVPGLRGFVERPKQIQIDYYDENAEKKQIVVEDFLATVFQHELDHLFGKLYIDRITDTTKISYNEEYSEFVNPHKKDELDE
ncbi:MAG: peptide deformylase [Bdellovibrionales bacterium]|nr:peptide deformylase [Bdellovibrionales bacterium]